MIKGVVFDLDGTLLNTLVSIGRCYNRVLSSHGLQTHPHQAFKQFIGNGARQCLINCLRASEELTTISEQEVDRLLQEQQEDYQLSWKNDVVVYNGIHALLNSLAQGEIKTAVLTNKDHSFAVSCIAHFFPDHSFDLVQGYTSQVPHKPNPIGALKIAEHMALQPSELILLGDSNVDMETANAARITAVGALWGFRDESELLGSGAEFTVDSPQRLLELSALWG